MLPERIGRYHVTRKIGSGGMGNVYLCTDDETGRIVALKTLPAPLAREEGFVQRFEREIGALKVLKSPHIVEFYDSGEADGLYFFTMEFVDGETLSARIRRVKRIPWREAIHLTLQLCSALKSAHDAGIIHRDLKPSNLLLTSDNILKLTDFGVAQVFAAEKLTVTGGIVGTAEYMSPEQGAGQKATKKSDLYSLGAVLYVMLTGKPPFSGQSSVEVIQKHRFGLFDRPRTIALDLPSWLDDLVCQLLEKNPEKRPPDAYVVLRRLQEVLAKTNLQHEQPTSVSHGPEGARSDPLDPSTEVDRRDGIGATFVRDMVRAELTRESDVWWRKWLNHSGVLWGLLLLLGSLCWWMLQSPTAPPEQRFARAEELMSQEPGAGWIEARDRYLAPLVREDRDRWKDLAQPYLEQIELYELERNLGTGRRRGKLRTAQSELERWLGLARAKLDQGDYATCGQILTAIRPLLYNQHESLQKLAERLGSLLEERRTTASHMPTFLENQLSRAEELSRAGEWNAAVEIWQAIVSLYAADPAAAASVSIAQEQLKGAAAKPIADP